MHAVLQIAFGWDGEHLHRFVIHGVEYGISYAGGGFRDDPHRVHLADLGLRPTELFVHDYDFTGGWRAGPSEGCGGPSPSTPSRTSCSPRSSARPRCSNRELAALLPLLGLERFDRRAVNRALAGLTEKQRRVA